MEQKYHMEKFSGYEVNNRLRPFSSYDKWVLVLQVHFIYLECSCNTM